MGSLGSHPSGISYRAPHCSYIDVAFRPAEVLVREIRKTVDRPSPWMVNNSALLQVSRSPQRGQFTVMRSATQPDSVGVAPAQRR